MTTIGREFMTEDMKGMVLTPDGDAVAIDICGRRVASLVPIDDNGLCRMELEEGFLPDYSIAKALWMWASSAFTGDSHFLGSFFMKVNEDGLPTGALYNLLLIAFFKDFMKLVQMSRFILDRGLGYRRAKVYSRFAASLKKTKSLFESYVRIYGDMLDRNMANHCVRAIGLMVDGYEVEKDRVSTQYHLNANELMKDIAIIGLLVTSIGLMIGWML
ncbi:MAG: hypothetical protein ACI38Y_04875 [Candidatus Methanomethylophilaceae archaeon]